MPAGGLRIRGEGTDPRTERTLAAIWQALLRLIDEKGYRKISVRDIAARAKVNRATFYRYYESKDDLFRRGTAALYDSIVAGIAIKAAEEPRMSLEWIHGYLKEVFDSIEAQRETLRILNGQDSNPEFRNIIVDKTEALLSKDRIELWNASLHIFDDPQFGDALARMISAALIRLILWWLSQAEPLPAERVGSMYEKLIVGGMKELLSSGKADPPPARLAE